MSTALLALAAAMASSAPVASQSASSPAKSVISDALGAILGANGPRALELIRSLPKIGLEPRDEHLRICAAERLTGQTKAPPELTDAFARDVLQAYRTYWQAAVMQPDQRQSAEMKLLHALRTLLSQPELPNVAEAEPLVADRLKHAGIHSLQGRTGLLHELMMWTSQKERTYQVELPEGPRPARVLLLDCFVSLGWSRYLTCDRTGTGGWAKPDGLYAVAPAYDSLNGENFRVTFLGHEAQHFADKVRFPDLEAWELEYRAKLVELAQADATRERVLARFSSDQGDDKASPHSYANKHVLEALRGRLGLPADSSMAVVQGERLREAAAVELRADSSRRLRQPQSAQRI